MAACIVCDPPGIATPRASRALLGLVGSPAPPAEPLRPALPGVMLGAGLRPELPCAAAFGRGARALFLARNDPVFRDLISATSLLMPGRLGAGLSVVQLLSLFSTVPLTPFGAL